MARPRPTRRPAAGAPWLLAAACLALLPACGPSPEPPAPPAANRAGNNAAGLSLSLTASAANFEGRLSEPAALTVTLRNAGPRAARLPGLQVVQGHRHLDECPGGGLPYEKNSLRYAKGLHYLLRFADGATIVVPHLYPREYRQGAICADGSLWVYGALEVPAGGAAAFTEKVKDAVFGTSTEVSKAFGRCKSFCLVVVAEGQGLRSNAVFLNGGFALPANFDPIAELRAYRKRAKDRAESQRRREEEELHRSLKEQGLPVPP
jgi:hypothetical protein